MPTLFAIPTHGKVNELVEEKKTNKLPISKKESQIKLNFLFKEKLKFPNFGIIKNPNKNYKLIQLNGTKIFFSQLISSDNN